MFIIQGDNRGNYENNRTSYLKGEETVANLENEEQIRYYVGWKWLIIAFTLLESLNIIIQVYYAKIPFLFDNWILCFGVIWLVTSNVMLVLCVMDSDIMTKGLDKEGKGFIFALFITFYWISAIQICNCIYEKYHIHIG